MDISKLIIIERSFCMLWWGLFGFMMCRKSIIWWPMRAVTKIYLSWVFPGIHRLIEPKTFWIESICCVSTKMLFSLAIIISFIAATTYQWQNRKLIWWKSTPSIYCCTDKVSSEMVFNLSDICNMASVARSSLASFKKLPCQFHIGEHPLWLHSMTI